MEKCDPLVATRDTVMCQELVSIGNAIRLDTLVLAVSGPASTTISASQLCYCIQISLAPFSTDVARTSAPSVHQQQ